MNGSRLFTVYDVCAIVQGEVNAEQDRINNELNYIEHVSNLHEFEATCYVKDVRKIVRGEA